MNTRHVIQTVVSLTVLLSHPMLASVQEYSLTVGGDCLVFSPQPDAGYVVETRQQADGISILSSTLGFSTLEYAGPIRGLGRHGVWVVEKVVSAGESDKTIKMLRANRQIQYVAPLFSSNGETVAIIPEIVVRVKPDMEIEQLGMLCATAGCTIKKRMEFTEQEYLLEVLGPDAEAVFAAVEQLSRTSPIRGFEPAWRGRKGSFWPKVCTTR